MIKHSPTIPDQTLSYIQSMLTELRILSEKQDAPMLAYLIEMAIIEADDRIKNIRITPHDPIKTRRPAAQTARTVSLLDS